MFDLTTTPAQEALKQDVAAMAPALRELGAACELERKPSTELTDHILGGSYPLPVLGGAPDPLGAVIAATEYGYADPGVALVIVGAWQAQLLLGASAGAATGQLVAPLLYEGYGRQPSECSTAATISGDGWSLTGRKESVLHPGSASVSVVLARIADSGELAVFKVDGTPDGYVVERDDALEGKLGLRAAYTGAVRLDGVWVPNEARISAQGELALSRAIGLSRSLLAAIALGSARASLDYAIGWAKSRTAFGMPIANYQGVAFVLADLETAIESARLLLWDAVTGLSRSADVAASEQSVGRAVARACAVANDAGRQGVNLLGVHGIITDHPVERWYRASAALSAIDFDPLAVALEVV